MQASEKIGKYFNENPYKDATYVSRFLKHEMDNMALQSDLYIRLETVTGISIYSSRDYLDENEGVVLPRYYISEVADLKKKIVKGKLPSYTAIAKHQEGLDNRSYLKYAQRLSTMGGDVLILFIVTPLYPVESTLTILITQLIYITIIALAIAFAIGLYLAIKISDPIKKIADTASKIGDEKYDLSFDKTQFTEINYLADTLNNTSLELLQSHRQQKDLIANISHDLRTPLTMIISYAEMIRDLSGDNKDRRNEHLNVIIDESARLSSLVTDLLEISKMQSGRQDINLTDFSLKGLIEELLKTYAIKVEQEGYKLVFISHGEGVIRADEGKIGQAVSNLVSNAFKYSGPDKTIEIKLFDEPSFVKVEVSDHGMGLSKRDMRHIWERYHVASTNRKRSNATGLGLSIVKEILLLHNASFGVKSELKKGSTFWFDIPKSGIDEDTDEIGNNI
jgi:signal transduction histidine kinase